MTAEQPILKAVVVGGSLAGLMAGIALARQGHRVTLLERADRRRPSGAALSVREADLRTILGPEHARAAVQMAGPRGARTSAEVPSTWAGLYEGLCQAAETEPAMTMLHHTRVVAVDQNEAETCVRTNDGRRYTADVLIGADGHRSLVRQAVAPDHPHASFAGYALWLGVADERGLGYTGHWPARFDIRDSGDHVLLGYPLAAPDGSTAPGDRRLGWAWYDRTRNHLFRSAGAVRDGVSHHSLRPAELASGVREELAREASKRWPRPWRDAMLDSI